MPGAPPRLLGSLEGLAEGEGLEPMRKFKAACDALGRAQIEFLDKWMATCQAGQEFTTWFRNFWDQALKDQAKLHSGQVPGHRKIGPGHTFVSLSHSLEVLTKCVRSFAFFRCVARTRVSARRHWHGKSA